MVDGTMVFEVSYFELMRRARVHTALETAEAARGKGVTRRVYMCIYIYVCMYIYIFIHTTSVEGLARERAHLFVKIIPEEKCLVFLVAKRQDVICAHTYIRYIYIHAHVYIHMYIYKRVF